MNLRSVFLTEDLGVVGEALEDVDFTTEDVVDCPAIGVVVLV
jgi:hypothetical protein